MADNDTESMGNETFAQVTEFILLGFSYPSEVKILLFVMLLMVYLINLTANILFLTVTLSDAQLYSPMYIFLSNLALIDLCYSSVNVLTTLPGLLRHRITIYFSLCITQMYFTLSLGNTECFLLTVMAWDRYVAICNPLNYQQLMPNAICLKLAVATWAAGFVFSLSAVVVLPIIHFCGHNVIHHTLCEADALSRLVCMDFNFYEISSPALSLFTIVIPIFIIIFTYCRIIATILRMPTAESRRRTFATCGSHLVVVILFYGTGLVIYMSPKSSISSEKDKSIALFYGLVVPALNPLIYTLRNKEVKGALKKLYIRHFSCERSRA